VGLAVFYPHPLDEITLARAVGYALALAGVTVAAFRLRASCPYALVGWLWFGVMLLPIIGLIQVGSQARADRYMYLPQIGLAIALAWGGLDLARRLRIGGRSVGVAATAAVVALAIVAEQQVSHWRDTISLHRRAIAVTADNFRAHKGLAAALRRAGELDEAAFHYAEAGRLTPRNARAQIGLAEVLAELGRLDEAIAAYQRGLELAPRHVRAHINLGQTLLRADRPAEARTHFERAFELDDGGGLAAHGSVRFLVSLHEGMAEVLVAEDDLAGAIEQLDRVLALRPGRASAHARLAELLTRAGDPERARSHAARARELRAPSAPAPL
jgi:tetratricopeptide (TPR) repeat protein